MSSMKEQQVISALRESVEDLGSRLEEMEGVVRDLVTEVQTILRHTHLPLAEKITIPPRPRILVDLGIGHDPPNIGEQAHV